MKVAQKVAQDSEGAGGSQQTFALPYIDGFARVEFSSKGDPPQRLPRPVVVV